MSKIIGATVGTTMKPEKVLEQGGSGDISTIIDAVIAALPVYDGEVVDE